MKNYESYVTVSAIDYNLLDLNYFVEILNKEDEKIKNIVN